jgi:hypothetical protein
MKLYRRLHGLLKEITSGPEFTGTKFQPIEVKGCLTAVYCVRFSRSVKFLVLLSVKIKKTNYAWISECVRIVDSGISFI